MRICGVCVVGLALFGSLHSGEPAPAGGYLTGQVVTPDGLPVAGARVWYHCTVKPIPETRSDAAGRFRLGPLPSGCHLFDRFPLLLVEADGWARQYVASPTVFAGADHDLDTITLVRGQQFSGVVLDHDGRPRANVPVEIGPWVNIRAHTSLHTGPNWTVLTDADGRFRTPQLPVGRMGAVVRLPERRHGVVGGWVPPGDGEESLPTIHLQKDRPITVTVVDDDGKPIPGAEATWGGTNVTVKTDAQGHLVLRGFGPEAHFQLNVWKENYTFSGEGYVNPPEQLTITLKRAGWIEGRAVDADTGAAVRLKGCMLCQFDRDKDGNVVRRG